LPIIDRALNIDSQIASPHVDWGYALLAQGDLAEAFRHFEIAMLLEPDYILAYHGAAIVLERTNHEASSDRLWRAAIARRPDDPEVLLMWGIFLNEERKQYSEAVKKFERAIELHRRNGEVRIEWVTSLQQRHTFSWECPWRNRKGFEAP
jgi:Tfp pilus assembly protein PilF